MSLTCLAVCWCVWNCPYGFMLPIWIHIGLVNWPHELVYASQLPLAISLPRCSQFIRLAGYNQAFLHMIAVSFDFTHGMCLYGHLMVSTFCVENCVILVYFNIFKLLICVAHIGSCWCVWNLPYVAHMGSCWCELC